MSIQHSHRRERDWVLGEFKAGRSPILIATDVASRGLGTCAISCKRSIRDSYKWEGFPSTQVKVAMTRFCIWVVFARDSGVH